VNADSDSQQHVASWLESVTSTPRARFSFQIKLADLAIIALFAAGSLAGFPGFAKLSEVKSQVASLDYKLVWTFLLFAFNYLVIYRKLAKGYFSFWLSVLHASLINGLVTIIVWIVATQSFLSSMPYLDALIAVQCGMAAVYLVVQNWIDFKSDLRNLGDLSRKIGSQTKYLEDLSGAVIKNEDLKEARDLCNKFLRDTDAALLENWRDDAVRAKLGLEKTRIENILNALNGLLSEVPAALRRMTAPDKGEASHG
jgi:hypothetical protein